MSKGLFHGAILQSGTAFDNWADLSQKQSLKYSEKMLDVMGCEYSKNDYTTALDCMRKKDIKDIVENTKHLLEFGCHPQVMFGPVKEVNSKAPFITDANYVDVASGSDTPVMMGMTANEGAILAAQIAADPKLIPQVQTRFDELIPIMALMYDRFDNETVHEKMQMIRDRYFNGADFMWAQHKKKFIEVSCISRS